MMGNWDTSDNGAHLNYVGRAEWVTSRLDWMPLQCRGTLGPLLHVSMTRHGSSSSPAQAAQRPCWSCGKAPGHSTPAFPRNIASLHLTPSSKPQKLYSRRITLSPAHMLWKIIHLRALGSLLLAHLSDESTVAGATPKYWQLLPFIPPIKKHEVISNKLPFCSAYSILFQCALTAGVI